MVNLTGLPLVLLLLMSGCATLDSRDAPEVRVVGLSALPSEGLELRFALKLRVQNPNESALSYDGLSVKLDLDGRGMASGVSNESGEIERFSDKVLSVPISISAFTALREFVAHAKNPQTGAEGVIQPIAFSLSGKLGAGAGKSGPVRFRDSGEIDFFEKEDDGMD